MSRSRYPGASRGPSGRGSSLSGCGYGPDLPSSWPGLTRPSSWAFRGRGGVFWTPGSSPGVTRGREWRPAQPSLGRKTFGMSPGFRRDSEGLGGWVAMSRISLPSAGRGLSDRAVGASCLECRYPGESRGPSRRDSSLTGCAYGSDLSSSWPGLTRPSSRAFRGRGGSFWTPGSSPGVTRGESRGLRSRVWGGGRTGWVPAFAGTARGEGGGDVCAGSLGEDGRRGPFLRVLDVLQTAG